jgi:polysaccharide chain length determinant protein (PEP-CTERM system associated)
VSEIFDLIVFYLNGIWKRRWTVALVAWIVAIPGWLVVASMPSIYLSSSRIYVDTSSVLQPLLRGMAVQTNLQTQVELMKQTLLSRPNLESVARKTDYALSATTDAEMETLLNSIQSRTTVLSSKQDVFSISFEDVNPQRAHDVVQALLTIFVESNLGQSRKDLDAAEAFIDRQIADYETRLVEAENKLARFKQDHMDVALGDGSYLSRASAATTLLKQLEQNLSVATAQRSLLKEELSRIPATLPAALTNGGPPGDTEARIVELEAKLRELLSQYTEKHPDVVRAKRQLDALLKKKQEAARAAATNTELPTEASSGGAYGEPNPVYEQIKMRMIEMDTQIEDLRQRSATARKEADVLASKAEEVPQIEAEFQRLNRDYNIIKARHDELLARRESARMSRNRDDIGQQVQYRMIDPPLVAAEPIGPNRPLFLNLVLVGAIGAGLGLALVLVVLDTSFATLSELRQYTDLPVLGAITDNGAGKRPARGVAGYLVLASVFASLVGILVVLHMIERQVGLDKIAIASLGDEAFQGGSSFASQIGSDVVAWIRATLQI